MGGVPGQSREAGLGGDEPAGGLAPLRGGGGVAAKGAGDLTYSQLRAPQLQVFKRGKDFNYRGYAKNCRNPQWIMELAQKCTFAAGVHLRWAREFICVDKSENRAKCPVYKMFPAGVHLR
jgi:hypothetical protein